MGVARKAHQSRAEGKRLISFPSVPKLSQEALSRYRARNNTCYRFYDKDNNDDNKAVI